MDTKALSGTTEQECLATPWRIDKAKSMSGWRIRDNRGKVLGVINTRFDAERICFAVNDRWPKEA